MSEFLNYMIGEAVLNTKTGKSVSKQVVEQKKADANKPVVKQLPKTPLKVVKSWQADREVFKKTEDERLKLKELKKQFKSGNRGFNS